MKIRILPPRSIERSGHFRHHSKTEHQLPRPNASPRPLLFLRASDKGHRVRRRAGPRMPACRETPRGCRSKYEPGADTRILPGSGSMSSLQTCPCCGYKTISEEFEFCEICGWCYDVGQHRLPDYSGGSNAISLREARRNYLRYGAKEQSARTWVRAPTSEDERDPAWAPENFDLGVHR